MSEETVVTKKWYKSKTLWGVGLAALTAASSFLGVDEQIAAKFFGTVQESVVTGNIEWVSIISTFAGLALAVYGRFKAKGPVN